MVQWKPRTEKKRRFVDLCPMGLKRTSQTVTCRGLWAGSFQSGVRARRAAASYWLVLSFFVGAPRLT